MRYTRISAGQYGTFGKILIYGILGLWTVVCIFPIYWVAVTSIKSVDVIGGPPEYLPFFDFTPSLDAWRFIFGDPRENVGLRFINSAAIGTLSTLLTLIIGGMAIYGVTRLRARARWIGVTAVFCASALASAFLFVSAPVLQIACVLGVATSLVLGYRLRRRGPPVGPAGLLGLLLATRILPPVIVVLPLYMMASWTGTLDTRTALLLTYTAVNLPVAAWLLLPILGASATEQEEAAVLDGASHLTIFFTILVPMVRAGLVAAGLLIFLLCWNEYLFAAYLTSENALTLPPWMVGQLSLKEAQIGGEAEEWANMSAATVVMVLPVLVFAAFAQRALGSVRR